MDKVLSFGEILLRLSPDVNGKWIDNASMPVYLGGAELNVAQALAHWQIPVAYLTAMPQNYMSTRMRQHLEDNGIDMTRTVTSGDRIGIYYLAQGTDLKHAEVIYDRAGSSTAMLQPGMINWDEVLRDVHWFHFSAISPAINANLAAVCKEGLEAASRKGITISVDLNYRAKLWKWGKKPVEVMPELVSYCDVVMGNIWAAETMLGIEFGKDFADEKGAYLEIAERSSFEIAQRFSKCRQVANTFRFDRNDHLQYYGTYYKAGELFVSKEHTVREIVDKVGSGDCFMAGLIYGNIKQLPGQELIDYAAASAVRKMGVMGDAISS